MFANRSIKLQRSFSCPCASSWPLSTFWLGVASRGLYLFWADKLNGPCFTSSTCHVTFRSLIIPHLWVLPSSAHGLSPCPCWQEAGRRWCGPCQSRGSLYSSSDVTPFHIPSSASNPCPAARLAVSSSAPFQAPPSKSSFLHATEHTHPFLWKRPQLTGLCSEKVKCITMQDIQSSHLHPWGWFKWAVIVHSFPRDSLERQHLQPKEQVVQTQLFTSKFDACTKLYYDVQHLIKLSLKT